MTKFYYDPTSKTAEGGYHIITDDGSYYDHIGGHSKILPELINPAHEITKDEYLAHVTAERIPADYISDSLPCPDSFATDGVHTRASCTE